MHAYVYITITKCRSVILCYNLYYALFLSGVQMQCIFILYFALQFRLVALFKSFVRLGIQKKFYKQMKAGSFPHREEFGVIFVALL